MPTESLTVESPTVETSAAELRPTRRILVFGRVQGLGIRPVAARVARRLRLRGRVANTRDGLAIELQGPPTAVDAFLAEFLAALPAGATVDRTFVDDGPPRSQYATFEIAPRTETGVGLAPVPTDRVICSACLSELRDPANRRAGYPFISCTDCGPRYSLVEAMPYDRAATSMRPFIMCAACEREYRTPDDRRFHSQTNACADCGPQVQAIDSNGHATTGAAAIEVAVTELRRAGIVALKALGGYQLLVDAASSAAVRRLRERKGRSTKPLAVLLGSLDDAKRIALLSDAERRLLADPSAPIVVVRQRCDSGLAAELAPAMQSIGLMLPTTPLHALLSDRFGGPLVCTSGNREGDPLVYDEAEAATALQRLADLRLDHDRPIVRPIDDSVVRIVGGAPTVFRLARGLAPHVVRDVADLGPRPIIALGGEQKAAIALWNGSQAVLGPHIGDLTSASACDRWCEQLGSFAALYGVSLDEAMVAHDRHPDYFSSRRAERFRDRIAVQHHHAHIAAVLLEHGVTDREVVGLAWDGTGYGDDDTIWGGETLRATTTAFQRLGRLRPFPLLGGEQAVRQPYRVAIALTCDALGPAAAARLTWPEIEPEHVARLVAVARRSHLSRQTSSMGRLFDGVAALVLGLAESGEEGRPAMLLEEACDTAATGSYRFGVDPAHGEYDWRPVVVAIFDDLARGVAPGIVAMRFHRAIADLAHTISMMHSDSPLVTGGGVFQNAVLGELLAERLAARPAGWWRPIAVPPGDGGLALGQLAVAAAAIQRRSAAKD